MNDLIKYAVDQNMLRSVWVPVVRALVQVESGGQTGAWNPEPKYRWFWNVKTNQPFRALSTDEVASKVPPADFYAIAGDKDQEWWGQQASWGLMQVMGAVAREFGYRGHYLPDLCVHPALNLDIGCRVLRSLDLWANGDQRRVLAAYNGGRGGWQNAAPQSYADKVLALNV